MSLVDVGYTTSTSSYFSAINTPKKNETQTNSTPTKKKGRTSIKGQTVEFREQRKMKNLQVCHENVSVLSDCRNNCNQKSSKDDRQIIWEDFRQLTDYQQRFRYLAQLIIVTPPAQLSKKKDSRKREKSVKYFLTVSRGETENDNKLCKSCFMKVFRVTDSKIRTLIEKKTQNGQFNNILYKRGKQEPKNKISDSDKEEAGLFLLSVPAYESHYGRSDSEKRYLPQYHSKNSLFEDFKGAYPSNRVNFKMFRTIFDDLGLSIKQKQCDTCKTCDALKIQVDAAQSEESRISVQIEQEAHWSKWKAAVSEKKKDALFAINDPAIKVVAYDLEQILPTPYLTTSVAFYMRQLSTFNLTIFDLATKESVHNIWNEATANRGSNEINSCMYKYALSLPPHVKKLIKYSDRCPGQNINIYSIVADMYLLLRSETLEVVESKFLVSGHTHMECDSAHAAIEKFKKRYKHSVEVPDDWIDLIRLASPHFKVEKMKHDDFLDYTQCLSKKLVYRKTDIKKNPWKFESIYIIRVEKQYPFQFKYKSSFDENEDFKIVSLLRKNTKGKKIDLNVQQKYHAENSNPITAEKKKDLLQLLSYIRPENHKFYQNLVTCD